MVRLNITMPEDVAEQLNHVRNKSYFIAQALKEKFQREKKQKLDELLVEGYKKSAAENGALNNDWEAGTLNDGWK